MDGLEICVAYEHDEHGAIVFAARAIVELGEATIVPLERLRQVRRAPALEASKLASAASLAIALAACTPHDPERGPVIVSDPIEVVAAPEVVIPIQPPPIAQPETIPKQLEEPCESEPKAEPRYPLRKGRGRIRRVAGRPKFSRDPPGGS